MHIWDISVICVCRKGKRCSIEVTEKEHSFPYWDMDVCVLQKRMEKLILIRRKLR